MNDALPVSDWHALARLADEVGTLEVSVTQLRGRSPSVEAVDNGGAQARCVHDDEWEGVVLADGARVPLDPDLT